MGRGKVGGAMNRRGFMGSILALGLAPAIVRASSLMPVRGYSLTAAGLLAPEANSILTISEITAEALRVLEGELILTCSSSIRHWVDPFGIASLPILFKLGWKRA